MPENSVRDALLAALNKAYPDDMIDQCLFQKQNNGDMSTVGDGLAAFIVEELWEVMDESKPAREQVDQAISALMTAIGELGAVLDAAQKHQRQLPA